MTVSLAIYGHGSVGSELVKYLQDSDLHTKDFRIEAICVSDLSKHPAISGVHITDDAEWLMASDGHNIVVDMLPGVGLSLKIINKALSEGKKVITCNKQLFSEKIYELIDSYGTQSDVLYLNAIPASAEPCEYDSVLLTNKNILDYDIHDLVSFRGADGAVTARYIFNQIVQLVDDANARCTA